MLAAQNALLRDFPDAAAAISLSRFQNDSFIESLASFLVQASSESIQQFTAQAKMAGVSDVWNTVDPAHIREMLINLVEGLGEPLSPPILQKRVRDEVNWKNSEKPWRRSPFWLVFRVGIRRFLALGCPLSEGRIRYKLLQCLFYSQMLNDGMVQLGIENCHFFCGLSFVDDLPSSKRSSRRFLFSLVPNIELYSTRLEVYVKKRYKRHQDIGTTPGVHLRP